MSNIDSIGSSSITALYNNTTSNNNLAQQQAAAPVTGGMLPVDTVTLSPEAQKMLASPPSTNPRWPAGAPLIINTMTLTDYVSGEALTGEALEFAKQMRESFISFRKGYDARKAEEAAEAAASKNNISTVSVLDVKTAVEQDAKWLDAGRKIPVSDAANIVTGKISMTKEQIYQTRNPFIERANRFAESLEFGLAMAESDSPNGKHFAAGIPNELQNFKKEMEQWDLMPEAKEYIDQYMQQKYSRTMSLEALYQQYGIA